ncbi:MAG: gamma-glutamyltransferase [Candidatus Latescibacterota bacterium]|nr:MAG: gamma-glutamyltransferase [Candidatus Latescibacterota bacterium]
MPKRHTIAHQRALSTVLVCLCVFSQFLLPACESSQDKVGGRDISSPTQHLIAGKSIQADKAVVVTADSIASRVGVDVLKRGGNAVDAAIAVAFALTVTYPRAGNIGGGGFMLIRLAGGQTHFIDYRETAPAAATRDMYLDPLGNVIDKKSTRGHLAAGVPGTVAGMALAHRRFGSLPWEDLLEYAWRLAKEGFPLDGFFVRSISEKQQLLESHPETRRLFVSSGLSPGDRFVQPELAETLHRLMTEGEKDFYRGKTADLIAAEMERGGGLITKADLASYKPVFREPIRASYRGFELILAPLPSSGGIILSELFQMLEKFTVGEMGYHSRSHVHLLCEAEKIVYRLRALYMGDIDFYPTPWRELVDPRYTDRLYRLIDMSRVLPVRELDTIDLSPSAGSGESEQTTHVSIVDQWGNAVANTYTLNGIFGSGVTVTGAGFLLNNEMDDFSIKPGHPNIYGLVGSDANAIAPGKRMLSSMSPTIVLAGNELFMIVGSPGGATIPTTVLQVISNVIDFGMTLEEAVAGRRVHNQYLPDKISIEVDALAPLVIEALETLGHKVVTRKNIGDVQAILIRNGRRHGDSSSPGSGRVSGVSDPRGNGRAIGY